MNHHPVAILYRILGNDLPPRHGEGQTLAQLRFLLEHEPELPGLEKRWLLNRIVDPAREAELIEAIAATGQRVDVIPFEPEQYRQVWTDIGETPEPFHPWGEGFEALEPSLQVRTVEYIARHKNRYVMNNNGARNQAIRLALADADWVFPWDGGCFLPLHTWQLLRPLTAIERLSYISVPMLRLRNNELLAGDPTVLSVQRDEPQLGFSRRARLHFDSELRYGSMPKATLLRRIALPGPWQDWQEGTLPWEHPDQTPAADAGAFVQAGVVFRLSGEQQDERHVDLAALQALRFDGIRRFTRRLDQDSLRRFLTAWPLRCWTVLANPAAGQAPSLPASLREQLARLAAAAREGLRPPDHPGAGWLDLPWQAICTLALDLHLHGTADAMDQLRTLLRRWFLEAERSGDQGGSAPLPPPGERLCEQAVAQLQGVYPLLDALTLTRLAGGLSPAELQGVECGIDSLLSWLCSDSGPFLRRHQAGPIATRYHLLVLAVAAHLGRLPLCAQAIDNLPGLLARQYRADGSPCGGDGSPSIREQLANLQAWAELTVLCSCLGRDLMAMRDDSGRGLTAVFSHAAVALAPHLHDPDDRLWWAWMVRIAASAGSLADPPPSLPAGALLPAFPMLCRRLDPLPREPDGGSPAEGSGVSAGGVP